MRNNRWLLLLLLLSALPLWSEAPLPERVAQAEACLRQAVAQPGQSAPLLRKATGLLPGEMTPALQHAAQHPTPEAIAGARQEIQALQRVIALQPPVIASRAPNGRSALESVLARKEYRPLDQLQFRKMQWTPPAWLIALGKWWNGVGQWWNRLLRSMNVTPPSLPPAPPWFNNLGPIIKYILIGLLVALGIFVIGLAASRIMAGRQRRTGDALAAEDDRPAPLRKKQEPTFWERTLQQAQELWQRGEQREALRMIYRACLLQLDARGVLRYDDTRANGEVIAELRRLGHTQVLEALRPIVRCFDRSWYGFLPISDEEFGAVLEQTRRMRQSLVGGG